MFEVQHIKNKSSNYIEVINGDAVYAKIDLKLGGSLQELICKGHTIISSKATLSYQESYASAILFPFANRIENGAYKFDGKDYQLEINKTEENNAIHGLVFDKTFTLVKYDSSITETIIHLRYIEKGEPLGFPFKYKMNLIYVITMDSVELLVDIKNIDEFSFPFTIGWHPYFVSTNLENSYLNLNSSKKILVNQQRIPTNEKPIELSKEFKIDQLDLDDCFILNNQYLEFKTPDYKLNFSFSANENYIQLYIPPNRKTIAIEPQTGSANNFNDNRGLKILQPEELFQVNWFIKIDA